MKLGDFYRALKRRFAEKGLETHALDARLLMAHALGMSHEEFLLRQDQEIMPEQAERVAKLAEQRLRNKPVAKIIGRREFYGRAFLTNEHTLDPRPDTEILIEAVLKNVSRDAALRILDLGTGTGCLLLTLLAELQQASGVAVDISDHALVVAKDNAQRLHVASRAEFVQSNWFDNVTGAYDVIVSNPPYIPSKEIAALAEDVKNHDPISALDGGADGLDPYREIVIRSPAFLKPNGLIALEVGMGQAPQVAQLLEKQGFRKIEVIEDLAGIERVLLAKRP